MLDKYPFKLFTYFLYKPFRHLHLWLVHSKRSMNICWMTGFQRKSCSPSTGFTGPTFPASSECQWERGRCRTIQGNGRGQVKFLCVASSSSVLRVNAYLKTFSLNSPDESTSHWLLCQGHMSNFWTRHPI